MQFDVHAELAMMKSYALASTGQDGKQATNRFVAYMVPKEVPQEPAHPSNRSPLTVHLLPESSCSQALGDNFCLQSSLVGFAG